VSEESSRIVSVLFSLIFIGASYFFTRFFIGRKDVALGVAFSLALSSSVIVVQAQYTREYALLAPLFLLFAWSVYRGITEKSMTSPQKGIRSHLQRNCNFHFGYLALSLGLLALSYTIHINSLILLPATYLFVLYLAATSRERRYVFLGGVGAIALLVLTYLAQTQSISALDDLTYYFTLFRIRNLRYLDYVVGYPFGPIGSGLLLAGLAGSFFMKDMELRNRRIFLYSIVGSTLCFFVLIADAGAAYRYTSHVAPIAIALILATLFYVIGRIRAAAPRGLSYALFAAWIGYLYVANIPRVYGDDNDRAHYSEAYATIVDTFRPGEDVIIAQFLRDVYLQDLPPDTKVISMGSAYGYTLERFQMDLVMEKSGFVTWATRMGEQNLSRELRQYINATLHHLHGTGVDDTKVEVYYFEN
jgi:hypothetical protein